ncbi:hypothetical protein J2Z22_002764 [Paenibacillus forsythiae]|uniref:Uncharacterized protein n=1 Tax=Paenibacillus forsythiae TaxID=365616 RepID=A0ABU3H8Q5_9BACL|nr:hypothetical protein [Paenibacillus forsythiae]
MPIISGFPSLLPQYSVIAAIVEGPQADEADRTPGSHCVYGSRLSFFPVTRASSPFLPQSCRAPIAD